jgi:hypothetical protein
MGHGRRKTPDPQPTWPILSSLHYHLKTTTYYWHRAWGPVGLSSVNKPFRIRQQTERVTAASSCQMRACRLILTATLARPGALPWCYISSLILLSSEACISEGKGSGWCGKYCGPTGPYGLSDGLQNTVTASKFLESPPNRSLPMVKQPQGLILKKLLERLEIFQKSALVAS